MFGFLYGIWRRRRPDDQDAVGGNVVDITISAPEISATGTAVLQATVAVDISHPTIEAASDGSAFTGSVDVSISEPIIRMRAINASPPEDTGELAGAGIPGGGASSGRIIRDVIYHDSPISRTLLRTMQDEYFIIFDDLVIAEESAIKEFRGG